MGHNKYHSIALSYSIIFIPRYLAVLTPEWVVSSLFQSRAVECSQFCPNEDQHATVALIYQLYESSFGYGSTEIQVRNTYAQVYPFIHFFQN